MVVWIIHLLLPGRSIITIIKIIKPKQVRSNSADRNRSLMTEKTDFQKKKKHSGYKCALVHCKRLLDVTRQRCVLLSKMENILGTFVKSGRECCQVRFSNYDLCVFWNTLKAACYQKLPSTCSDSCSVNNLIIFCFKLSGNTLFPVR